MSQPPPNEPIVQRIFREYTEGSPNIAPDKPGAVAVGTTNLSNPPAFIQLLNATMKFAPPLAITALSANQSATVTVQIGLSEFSSVAVSAGRELRLSMAAGGYHSIAGLALMSVQVGGIVTTSDNAQISGSIFAGGATYTSFTVQVILRFWSVQATAAGNVAVWASATLYDAPSST